MIMKYDSSDRGVGIALTPMVQRRQKCSVAIVGWVLVVCLSAIFDMPVRAQETLTLQGPNPQLTFDDNAGLLQMWNIFGDDAGFDVIDPTAGTSPFHIEPAARDNSLFLGTSGHVGFGTALPLAELHVSTSGLFPTLRLQSTSGSPRVWDLRGSGGSFDLLDVTNSNAIPFGVQSGAPTNTMYLSSTGWVGIGTGSPQTFIHARKPAEAATAEVLARFDISDDPVGKLEISNVSSTNGIFHPRMRGTTNLQAVCLTMEGMITDDVGNNPIVSFAGSRLAGGSVVNRPLVAFRNNQTVKVTVAANGNVTATSFITASSRSLKDNIVDLDSMKAQAALRQLTPVEFTYKDDPTSDHRVGFIAEDVPEIIAEADRKAVPVMDVVALVTRVVKDQQQTIEDQKQSIEQQKKTLQEQRKSIDDQKAMIDELMRRLSQVEARLPETK